MTDTALRFVALDLSLTATGVAWTCDWHGREVVGCRTVTDRWGPDRPHERIRGILEDIAAAVRCKPHLVVIEGAAYNASGNAVDQLAGLRWIVKQWLWSEIPGKKPRLRYIEIDPSTLKVWAAGKGDAPKRRKAGADGVERPGVLDQMIAAYGRVVQIRTTDEADAVGLLSFAAAAYGQPIATIPGYARRALTGPKAPKWPDLATETGPVVPTVGAR